MPRSEIIERERRWALPAAIAAFGVLVLTIVGLIIAGGADLPTDDDSGFLRAYAEDSGILVPSAILQGLGYALIAIPLLYLFRATEARSDRVRRAFVGIIVAGPLFLGIAFVLQAFAYDSIASDFVANNGAECAGNEFDTAVAVDDCVEDIVAGNGTIGVATGLTLAGTLGLIFGLIYTSLNAMRVGLLSRFMGTLGMAVGASLIFFGPPFVVLFMVGLGALFMGWVPGGKPPAWKAGEAVPWPSAGERQAPGPDPDEPVEGRADEIFPDAPPPEEDEPKPGSIADEVERASRRADSDGEGGTPQKRKRRS